MRHNKMIGWSGFLSVVDRLEKVSPWLSRQLTKRAAEWPFWYSGMTVEHWRDRSIQIGMPVNRRNSVGGEISAGHLLLGAELAVRLVLLRYREELPFAVRVKGAQMSVHHVVEQPVNFRFGIDLQTWECMRLTLLRDGQCDGEFVVPAFLADGRAAATFTVGLGFRLEKSLPA